jgi:nucleoside-diphosphate-sugar epimerase
MSIRSPKILVTGACGQIGTELVVALRNKYGAANVIATDILDRSELKADDANYFSLNVLNANGLEWIIQTHRITEIYHLAAMLSAKGEQQRDLAWEINMRGLLIVLEAARKNELTKIFWPSSIAIFGPASSQVSCPQNALPDPATVYGISKQAGEYWCQYYNKRYGMDIRSLRYPGLISHSARGGGGTTDYAIDIFYDALEHGHYTCFLSATTWLPMLYMPDAIRATIELMEAPKHTLSVHSAYNLHGLSFTPRELANAIKKHVKGFVIDYQPDFRQEIADSWPGSIDDSEARFDWKWKPQYNLEQMVGDMLANLRQKEPA